MPKTILLIEDDLATIDVYTIALKKAGFEVEVINLGNEAIEKIKEIAEQKAKKPALVLLDLLLPDVNGIEVFKVIREQKETKDIPVFVLTNYSDDELKKKSQELKAEEYITKADYGPKEIVKMVKEKLKNQF